MQNLLILLGFISFSFLPFLAGNLQANQANSETGSHKNYKPRDSAPYKNLASILKTAHKKGSEAKVSSVAKKVKSSSSSVKKHKRIAADKKGRSLRSTSGHKASSKSISTGKTGGSKKLTQRASRLSGKLTHHKNSYSAKYSSKSKNAHKSLNRKRPTTATKSVSK